MKKKKKATTLFPSGRPGASGLGKQSSSKGDSTPLKAHTGSYSVGGRVTSPWFTHSLYQHSAPSFSYVCCAPLVHPPKPLPFITPQVKSHLDVGSAPFSGSCCLGVDTGGWNTELQSNTKLGPWPSQYHHL